ncbi:MAG: GNAT family N-acetyltransferase [Erysipelotrichaceae bacterium]|nr:GNAT family N-acetyltransferase [Erysipelotrichaceae bacterium]
MLLRKAQNSDIPALLELLKQVNLVHHIGRPDLFDIGTKYTSSELETLLADPKRPVFVAEEDGRVLGYCFGIHEQILNDNIRTPIKTLYIDDLCVDERSRGKGIGRSLYNYAVDYARENGFYNVTLNVWECNESAKRFYESLGMQIQKTGMETIL